MLDCAICKMGKTKAGQVTVTLQREGCTVIIKDVPAQVCDNCGEYYLSAELTQAVLQRAEDAVKIGAEVEIIRFAA